MTATPRFRYRLFGALLAALAWTPGCMAPGVHSPAAPVLLPLPSQAPDAAKLPLEAFPLPSPAPKRYVEGFEGLEVGSEAPDFANVTDEVTTPAWVYAGHWRIAADENGNKVLLQDEEHKPPGVTFLRYKGSALGSADGRLPNAYFAEVSLRPLRSLYNYPPTGDQGTPFYFLSYDTYLEVVIKPDWIEIWEANGAEPKTTKGWRRLWYRALATKEGDVRRVGALVDMAAGQFTAYLDGAPLATVESPLLHPQPAWLALRAIGNVVSFDDLLIEPR